MPEKCIWPPQIGKKLNFLRFIQVFDLVLKCCSDTSEGTWIKVPFYFLLFCVGGYSCAINCMWQ